LLVWDEWFGVEGVGCGGCCFFFVGGGWVGILAKDITV